MPKPVYTRAERNALVAEAERRGDILIRDLIILFAHTGLRFKEGAELTPASLRCDGRRPSIVVRAVERGRRQQRGRREIWSPKHSIEVKCIPMTAEVERMMRKRSRRCKGYLFQNRAGNKIAGNKTLERLKALFPAVDIDLKTRPLNWHSFRRYFVKTNVEAGVPLHAIMKMTGHDTVQMALEYLNADFDDAVRGIERLEAYLNGEDEPNPDEDDVAGRDKAAS